MRFVRLSDDCEVVAKLFTVHLTPFGILGAVFGFCLI